MPFGDNQVADNRHYDYAENSRALRREFFTIVEWVPPGSGVLDLGCGDGSLLELLVQKKNVRAEGIELTASGRAASQAKGLVVRQGRIDEGLPWPDNSFDVAICNVTLQMVMYPERLLREMARVARRQIISFPNFANIKNRLELLILGRMPRAMLFGYSWWNTGHIHQLSLKDFTEMLPDLGLEVLRHTYFGRLPLKRLAPNLLATLGLFELARR